MLALTISACSRTATPTPVPSTSPTPSPTAAATAEATPTDAAPTSTPVPTAAPTEVPTEVPSDIPLICQGIFQYMLNGGDQGQFLNYIHFYESGIYYISIFNGGQFAAGYYEIKDEPFDYTDKEGNAVTTAQTILLTDLDGSEYETLGYDAENGTIGIVKHVYDNVFVQVFDSGHTDADENGVAIIEFMLGGDEYSLVRLMHNGTFQDTIGAMLEGIWAVDGNVYTLTESETEDNYTVTLSADGNTGEYKGLDGTTETLNLVKAAEAQIVFRGSADGAYGAMEIEINCYEGGALEMVLKYAGTENTTDGKWALFDDKGGVNLTIDDTEYQAPINMADYSFSFDLVTSDGVQDITVVMSTAEAVSTVYTFTGKANTNVIMECYSDGTCAVIYTGMGPVTTGTWVMDTSNGPLPQWTIGLAETFEDQGVTVETDYATEFFFTFKNATGQLEEILALPYSAMQ
jgi:hypothetical protein